MESGSCRPRSEIEQYAGNRLGENNERKFAGRKWKLICVIRFEYKLSTLFITQLNSKVEAIQYNEMNSFECLNRSGE